MTDHEIAKHLDSKQYGTIREPGHGHRAIRLMLIELENLGRLYRGNMPHVLELSRRLDRGLVCKSQKEQEMSIAELDHDGYPETAREFADVLKQMRSLKRGRGHLPWGG